MFKRILLSVSLLVSVYGHADTGQSLTVKRNLSSLVPINYLLLDDNESQGTEPDIEDVCDAWDGTFPEDAFVVTSADRTSLQTLLDTHDVLRLMPGDYRTGGPSSLTIGSDQAIIALTPTKFPDIQVAAGARRTRIEGLQQLDISFMPGASIRYGCFRNLREASIIVDGAIVERNLFVAMFNTNLFVDTSQSGHFSDNRFIKLNSHGKNLPINIKGDSARTSGGNAFLLVDSQTPPGSVLSIDGQRDISFVSVDIEAYNWNRAEAAPFALRVRNTGTFRAYHSSGMTRLGDTTNPAFDIDAEKIFFHRFTANTASPTLRVGPLNEFLFSWRNNLSEMLIDDDASDGLRFFAQEYRDAGLLSDVSFSVGDTRLTQEPAASIATPLRTALTQPSASVPWSIPTFGAIPNPTGSNWNSNLAQQVDESAAIQAMIDNQGVAYLEPRVYYIGSPIVLDAGEGLVGAGVNKTAIVALSPDIDMITLAWTNIPQCLPITDSFTLAEITLQGGRNGVRSNTGGTQINRSTVSHVTFRNMANAGILIEGTYGWDNNVLSYVNYVDSAYGILQQGQPKVDSCYANGEWDSMSYLDKTVLYRNQFLRLGRAIELNPTRANNLNGIVESSFEGSTVSAIALGGGNKDIMIASSRFVDNAGNPTISGSAVIVNSAFEAGRAQSLLGHGTSVEGSLIKAGSATNATLFGYVAPGDFRNPRFFDATNSTIEIPLGSLETAVPVAGMLFNNDTITQAPFNNFFTVLEYITEGTVPTSDDSRNVIPLLSGDSVPGSQLLRGGSWTD